MVLNVIGWYGHNNIGDEAYKIAIPKIFPGEIIFSETIEQRDDINLFLLGGGDVVSSFFVDRLKYVDKKKMAASVSISANSSLSDLHIFDKIYVRDMISYRLASKFIDPSKLEYLPDFAFILKPDVVRGNNLIQQIFDKEEVKLVGKTVVVNINSYLSYLEPNSPRKGFINFLDLVQDLSEVFDQIDANILFLPFGTKFPADDRATNGFAASHCEKQYKNVVVYDRFNVQDTLDIISACDAVVSSRLHCSIFSTICGKPFIDITHHDKTSGFLETIGKEDWSISFWNFDNNKFKNMLEKFLSGYDSKDLVDFTNKSRAKLEGMKIDSLSLH